MAVYGYCRVSTSEQAERGDSLQVQQEKITGMAQILGVSVDCMLIEQGVSGSIPLADRPQGGVLLAEIGRGDTVIAVKLDRMFRNALDALTVCERFRKEKIKLYLMDMGHDDVTGNGVSRLFFNMVAAFADFERERIALRNQEAKANLKAQGRHMGGSVPWGYRKLDDGALVELADRSKLITTMKRMRAKGKSLRAIAAHISGKGIPITHQGVKNVLSAEHGTAKTSKSPVLDSAMLRDLHSVKVSAVDELLSEYDDQVYISYDTNVKDKVIKSTGSEKAWCDLCAELKKLGCEIVTESHADLFIKGWRNQ